MSNRVSQKRNIMTDSDRQQKNPLQSPLVNIRPIIPDYLLSMLIKQFT